MLIIQGLSDNHKGVDHLFDGVVDCVMCRGYQKNEFVKEKVADVHFGPLQTLLVKFQYHFCVNSRIGGEFAH